MFKGGDELARERVPKLGAAICARGQNPSTVRAKGRVVDRILVVKGGDELARGGIPQLCGFIPARCQDPSTTVGTKRGDANPILVSKRGDEFARGAIPKLCGFVRARRQDSSTVRTKLCIDDAVLMIEGGD